MRDPRDTQFAGFAELLEREISDAVARQIISMESGVIYSGEAHAQLLRQIIARRAYDLVINACSSILASGCVEDWRITPKALTNTVLDFIQWPEEKTTP